MYNKYIELFENIGVTCSDEQVTKYTVLAMLEAIARNTKTIDEFDTKVSKIVDDFKERPLLLESLSRTMEAFSSILSAMPKELRRVNLEVYASKLTSTIMKGGKR